MENKSSSLTRKPASAVLPDQLLETWRINNRINLMVLQSISDAGFDSTLSVRGGRTIVLQFAHMHNVRLSWLEHLAKEIFKKYAMIDKEGMIDGKTLQLAFQESGRAIEELIHYSAQNNYTLKSFSRGLIVFLGYLISHEAHHRGSILLTLKQTGHKIDEKVRWGIWEWNKI